jgi:hypothetical protein
MRLTQPELAVLMSMHSGTVVDVSTISRHESIPATRKPTFQELHAYSKVFKIPTIALYSDLYDQDQIFALLAGEGDWVWTDAQEELVTNGQQITQQP